MSTQDDGGAAFPVSGFSPDQGMTLRDWFAAHAPSDRNVVLNVGQERALLGHDRRPRAEDYSGQLSHYAAVDAAWRYRWADAMLAERKKGGAA